MSKHKQVNQNQPANQNQQMVNYVNKPKVSVFINETDLRLFSMENESGLDIKIQEMESLMKNKHGFGASEVAKDELYGESKKLWKEFAEKFQHIKFSFYLNRPQFNYLTNLLTKNLEYGVDNVFFVIELGRTFDNWEKSVSGGKFQDDKEVKELEIPAIDMEYIWALISPHKVKGLSKDTYLFAQVIQRMMELRSISMYYDSEGKRLGKSIQEWVASFEADPSQAKMEQQSVEAVGVPSRV